MEGYIMNDCPSNIILINGPTGSGKSLYIRQLGATPANTLNSEQLVDEILEMCHNKTSLDDLVVMLHYVRFFENMESLRGKEETQKLAAQLVLRLSSQHRIVITGIDFKGRLPFFLDSLKSYQFMQLPKRC